MKFYEAEKINDNITVIRSLTGEILYLVEGRKRAVLIDTSLGIRGLAEYVRSLTSKPLTVLLTHGHVDHAPGAVEFDTVYLNHRDLELYKRHCLLEERKGYIMTCLGEQFELFDETELLKPEPEKEFLDLKDGMEFDLGGVRIQVQEMPGHTKGSVVFLIPEARVLILGDACNNSTFLFDEDAGTVTEYLKTLEIVEQKLRGMYDKVYLSHPVMEVDSDIIENMIEVCKEILTGESDDLPFTFMGKQALIAKTCNQRFERTDGKSGNLIYRKEKE